MTFISTYSILALLIFTVIVSFVDRLEKLNTYWKSGITITLLITFILVITDLKELWHPSMGLGVLFFMGAIFIAGTVSSVIIGGLALIKKVSKHSFYIIVAFTLISPFAVYGAVSTLSWYHIDRYITIYCFSSDSTTYHLRLDSRDLTAYIGKELGPLASASYFDGYYQWSDDSIIIKGEKLINQEKTTYSLVGQRLIGFPEKTNSIKVKSCQ